MIDEKPSYQVLLVKKEKMKKGKFEKQVKKKKIEMPTIQDVKLSSVFDEGEEKEGSLKEFEIKFDQNADVNPKKTKSVLRRILAKFMWIVVFVNSGVGA